MMGPPTSADSEYDSKKPKTHQEIFLQLFATYRTVTM